MKSAIIGFGIVGQAVYASMKSEIINEAKIYDISNGSRFRAFNEQSAQDILDTEILFLCVNTPTDDQGIQDATVIQNILDILQEIDYSGVIVIKSTVLLQNIDRYLNGYLKIVVSPEFLNANSANDDFNEQTYIVLGGSVDLTVNVMRMYSQIFQLKNEIVDYELCSIKEAIDFKYMRNTYQAYKVLFWEFVQDTTGNARKMSKMLSRLPMDENSQISMDGYRGFGQSSDKTTNTFSACLSKDVEALSTKIGNKIHPTLNYMLSYNKKLLKD